MKNKKTARKRKNKLIIGTVITGALCTALIMPSFAFEFKFSPVSAKNIEIVPISYKYNHWAEMYLEQLSTKYNVESVFKDKDLEAYITEEDFLNIVRLVFNEEYDGAPDALTREAIVHEFVKIWAQETNQNLDEIAVIQMIFYADTDEIDPKYNHSVAVAYVNGIAKGRNNGIFAPKDNVKYGELATLALNTRRAIDAELDKLGDEKRPENEQKVEEERFETRGSYKIEDDRVVFDFELINHYNEVKKLMFSSGQQFEIAITDEKGEEVYRYSDGKFFTMALVFKDINPGESLKWQDAWDMTNKKGEKLTQGKFKAKINILARLADGFEESSEKIDESQLSTIIEFSIGKEVAEDEVKDIEGKVNDIMKPEVAKEIIKETADKVINAISKRDAELISEYVHPEKGVRFTPYTHVSLENDVVFSKDQVKNFFKDENTYLWGHYDGSGEEIRLTPSEYYEKFIYTADFMNAEKIGYNEVLSNGNMLENQFDVYDNPIIVEYYFSGFNPEYIGMDWQSLRLVFEEYEGSWKLVGIIHNQWTI